MRARDLALCLSLWILALPARAQDAGPATGEQLYLRYCASCHGADGRGNTDLAALFERRPPDLSQIEARRKGWFPELVIQDIIDGRFAAHGEREMPVWGDTLSHTQIQRITEHVHTLRAGREAKEP